MTVSQVLAAHASAQIQAAQAADEARRIGDDQAAYEQAAAPSFVETWACESTVIGFVRKG